MKYLQPKRPRLYGRTPRDRRTSRRYSTTMLARCDGNGKIDEYRGDVNRGGFCFVAKDEVKVGQTVEVIVRLPGPGDWIHGYGRVLGIELHGRLKKVRGHFIMLPEESRSVMKNWQKWVR